MIKQDIYSDSWCDIVFEDRNKEYGAYVLRKQNKRNTTIAILTSIAIFVFVFSVPTLIRLLTAEEEIIEGSIVKAEPEIIEAPPLDETKPPPPPEPPPLMSTIKFTPPVVVKDEEVEEAPPPIIEFEEKKAAQQTEEGDTVLGVDPSLSNNQEVGDGEDQQIYIVVEQMPEFVPGKENNTAIMEFIKKNVKYPELDRDAGIQGTVTLSFVVDGGGKVKDINVLKGVSKNIDAEAIRVIKAMPDWKPGKQNGRPAKVKFTVPVKFKLG